MKWYDNKTPERLSTLAVQMIAFILGFSISQGPIKYKLALVGVLMLVTPLITSSEDDPISKKEIMLYTVLPAGLLVSSAIMMVNYHDVQMILQTTENFLRAHSLEVLWILSAFLTASILNRKTKSSSR